MAARGSFLLVSALVCVLVIVIGAKAASTNDVENNNFDLKADKFFSRPITELELIILNLKKRAEESANFLSLDRKLHIVDIMKPEGNAGFDPASNRIYLVVSLHVSEMSDPWQEVCDATIKSFYGPFYFPAKSFDADTKLRVLEKYLGEAVRIDEGNAKAVVDELISSLIVRATFLVGDMGKLKFLRTCTQDNATGKISYTEYRY